MVTQPNPTTVQKGTIQGSEYQETEIIGAVLGAGYHILGT